MGGLNPYCGIGDTSTVIPFSRLLSCVLCPIIYPYPACAAWAGFLPEELGGLRALHSLDVSNNKLVGEYRVLL